MKKLFISLLFLLSASFMFADTLHVFVPYCTRTGEVLYNEIVFRHVKYSVYRQNKPGFYCIGGDTKTLFVTDSNGKEYKFSYRCNWYSEPDGE